MIVLGEADVRSAAAAIGATVEQLTEVVAAGVRDAERQRCVKLVRDEATEAAGCAWYHPQFNLESLADRMEGKPDGT